MDYEKKYKEALEIARKLYNEAKANEYTSDMEDYESIFPELAESEDEKIRKSLLGQYKGFKSTDYYDDGITFGDVVNWLEKQKKQKPAEWSDEDEKMLNLIIARLHSHPNVELEEYGKSHDWLNSLKERCCHQKLPIDPYWTCDDEEELTIAIDSLEKAGQHSSALWVKNLASCKQWKPTEEQIKALERKIGGYMVGEVGNDRLKELLEQLKAL